MLTGVREVARVMLPTTLGAFEARAFESPAGTVHLALLYGDLGDGESVLVRLHSECLTGDALGSLRCDCGIQLRDSLRAITVEGRGVLVYIGGHEGRGIGLVNKLRAYVEQDLGSDTVDANLHLGLPVDARDYGEAAQVLRALGVTSVRLMTNNPSKVIGLQESGIDIEEVRGLPVAAGLRNLRYLETKKQRLGHSAPLGSVLVPHGEAPADVTELLGSVRPRHDRPYVVLKYAQSLDGRIATARGDSKWISGHAERALSHGLRARCDAVMVGAGTVLADDPQLTVRLVPGASPARVVVDSTLRTPIDAKVLDDQAPTIVITTERSATHNRKLLRDARVTVQVVPGSEQGVDMRAALLVLRQSGIESLLVEGGARVITSLLERGLVDRLVLSVAPLVLGRGVEAVGDLGVASVANGLSLGSRSVYLVGRDVVLAWDVLGRGPGDAVVGEGSLDPSSERTRSSP